MTRRRHLLAAAIVLATGTILGAQVAQGPAPPAAAQQSARAAAPIDIAGTWASVVTEDWQWRYITPAVGDYTGVPMTAEATKIAKAWNPEADVKAGAQCKPFGAAGIMRLPTRLQIAWVDDNTLKLDWDLGTQSRLVHFDKTRQPGARALQGHAVGEWIDVGRAGGRGRGGGAAAPPPEAPARAGGAAPPPAARGRGAAAPAAPPAARGRGGAPAARPGGLRIVTTNLAPQYVRMNGAPISERATVTDVLDLVPSVVAGEQFLIVRTTVEDPLYLSGPYVTSQQFKREANAAKWNPTPCDLLPRARGSATQVPGRGGGG
jgi:hypothetical protein